MPTPLSPFPTACPPAPSLDTPALADDLTAGDAGASFDSVFSQTSTVPQNAPRSGKSSPGGSEKTASANAKSSEKSVQISNTADDASSAPDRLTEDQLAALLALMGAPTVPPPLPPPAPTLSLDRGATASTGYAATEPAAAELLATGSKTATTAAILPVAPATAAAAAPESFVVPGDVATAPGASPAADAPAPSVHELLAQGAETIDYQLTEAGGAELPPYFKPVAPAPQSAASAPSTLPASAPISTPITAPVPAGSTANPTANTFPTPEAPVSTAAAASVPPDRVLSGVPVAQAAVASAQSASVNAAVKPVAKGAAEKNAASGVFTPVEATSRVKTPEVPAENKFLNIDSKEVKTTDRAVGTGVANWGVSMKTPSHNPLDSGAAYAGSVFPAALRGDASPFPSQPAATTSAPQAAQIVREIRDIADGLWAVERNSVEVRFNFNENERLSVRVEYKNGVVQTTFRTDSPELRDTIAREWQAQIASTDARPYRVADPVFNTPAPDARGFSLGGDASRQQQQRQAEQSATPASFAASFGRSSAAGSSLSAPATNPVLVRPDTALHLHAFA